MWRVTSMEGGSLSPFRITASYVDFSLSLSLSNQKLLSRSKISREKLKLLSTTTTTTVIHYYYYNRHDNRYFILIFSSDPQLSILCTFTERNFHCVGPSLLQGQRYQKIKTLQHSLRFRNTVSLRTSSGNFEDVLKLFQNIRKVSDGLKMSPESLTFGKMWCVLKCFLLKENITKTLIFQAHY